MEKQKIKQPMNKTWPWIIIIIVGIVGLFVASRFFAPKPIETPVVEQTTSPTEIVDGPSLPEGWQEIDGGDFTIDLPLTWFVSRDGKTDKIFRLASADSQNAYANPEEIVINLEEFSKSEKTLEQLLVEKTKGSVEAAAAVEFMKTTASPPFNEITINDIKTSTEEITLNNRIVVTKNVFQCLKPCDAESGAHTLTQYFFETEQNIYLFSSLTGIDERADALRLVAEQIVKTFKSK